MSVDKASPTPLVIITMKGMSSGDMPRPFHERFDIKLGTDEAIQRFVNRVSNVIFDQLNRGLLGRFTLSAHQIYADDLRKHVANSLGDRYDPYVDLEGYVNGDFRRCLHVLEALHNALKAQDLRLCFPG